MPKSFGLLSKVTLVARRIGVDGDWRMIAMTLLRRGAGSLYQDPGRARGVHGGADLSTSRRSLPTQSAERFRWTNAARFGYGKVGEGCGGREQSERSENHQRGPARPVPMAMPQSMTFCGRTFGAAELELMRQIAGDFSALGVTEIARTVCELLEWRRPRNPSRNYPFWTRKICAPRICWVRLPYELHQANRGQLKYRCQRLETAAKRPLPKSAEAFSATAPACCACRRQNPITKVRLATTAAITT